MRDVHALVDNYYALTAAICNESLTIDKALSRFSSQVKPQDEKFTTRSGITVDDIAHMIKLKRLMTYAQVGKIYGLTAGAVYNRIKRYKELIQ